MLEEELFLEKTGKKAAYQENAPNTICRWQLERLKAGKMHDDKSRPDENHIKESHKSKE